MKINKNELMYQLSFSLDCVEHDLLGASTGHGKRVACMSMEIGRRLGFEDAALSDLSACAVLHDNALTEYILAERIDQGTKKQGGSGLGIHCTLGEENAKSFPFSTDTAGFILYHHEEGDGSGPFGKKLGEIPIEAAIIHLADRVDVLFHIEAVSRKEIERMEHHVRDNTGIRYERKTAEVFLDLCHNGFLEKLGQASIDEHLKSFTSGVNTEVTIGQILKLGEIFARIIDYKSPFTRRHSLGIAEKVEKMAGYYQMPEEERAQMILAAYLHDVGKLAITPAILEKPGELTDSEYAEIKKHVYYTYLMLSQVTGLEQVCRWASDHHEKLDGTGYPFGKKADELDRNSRLMGCIDIYQALTEDRPYRAALSHWEAMEMLQAMAADGKLDQDIVEDISRVLGCADDGNEF